MDGHLENPLDHACNLSWISLGLAAALSLAGWPKDSLGHLCKNDWCGPNDDLLHGNYLCVPECEVGEFLTDPRTIGGLEVAVLRHVVILAKPDVVINQCAGMIVLHPPRDKYP